MAQQDKYTLLLLFLLIFSPFGQVSAQYDTIYNENNKLFGIGKLLNSQKIGTWRFYQNNKIVQLVTFDSSGTQNGKYIEFSKHDSTQIFLESNYYNGKLNGESVMYFKYPQIQNKERYRNGLLHGTSYYFYENGNIGSIINFHEGIYDGEYKGYYSNGTLCIEGSYEKGNKVGVWNEYHKNGNKSASGRYVYGFRTESEKFDSPDGGWGMADVKVYDKDGEWELYDTDGNLYKIETYKGGILIGTRRIRK